MGKKIYTVLCSKFCLSKSVTISFLLYFNSHILSEEQRHEVRLHYHHKLAEQEAAMAAKKQAAKAEKLAKIENATTEVPKVTDEDTTAQEDIDKLLGRGGADKST